MKVERLGGFDASLLYLETPWHPMTACTLMELDTSTIPDGYSFDRFRRGLSARIEAVPEFRAKLADSRANLDTPALVDDPGFELDRHLHRVALPSPGSRAELSDICGHLAAIPLNRSQPLWEMWVIEGRDGTDPHNGGRIAVMLKVHHALIDGETGRSLLSRLCSTEISPPPPQRIEGYPKVSTVVLVLDGLMRFARRPVHLVRTILPALIRTRIESARRARSGQAMSKLMTAPRVMFNGNMTAHRNIAFTQLDLEDVKTVKNTFGVTLNDVMLAIASGALRQFLLDREELPEASLIVTQPVSQTERTESAGRNQMSAMFCSLRTDIADPAARLKAIAEGTSIAKEHRAAMGMTTAQDALEYVSPRLLGLAIRLYTLSGLSARRPVYNMGFSNVRGQEMQCYLLGAAITARYGLGPAINGVGLNGSVISHNGKLDIGFVSCPQLMPDLWDLVDGFPVALKELLDAAN